MSVLLPPVVMPSKPSYPIFFPVVVPVTRRMRQAVRKLPPPELAAQWSNLFYLPSTKPDAYKGKRVAVLTDIASPGLGGRIIFAQVVHALVAAGAEVAVFYTCPDALVADPKQQQTLFVIRQFYPTPWPPNRRFTLDGFDYLAWAIGYKFREGSVPKFMEGITTVSEWCRRKLGFDLFTRLLVADPIESPADLPPDYHVVVTDAGTRAEDVPAAVKHAVTSRDSGIPLLAVGLGSEPLPDGVEDRRNLPLHVTSEIIRRSAWGCSADTGLAHVAGFYGKPWTVVGDWSRQGRLWWQSHYPLTRRVESATIQT